MKTTLTLAPEIQAALRCAVAAHGIKQAKSAIRIAWSEGCYRKMLLDEHAGSLQRWRNSPNGHRELEKVRISDFKGAAPAQSPAETLEPATLTENQASELLHKFSILRDEADLQEDYGITAEQAAALHASVPWNGGDWHCPLDTAAAAHGELRDHAVVLRDQAEDARSNGEQGQALQIHKLANFMDSLADKIAVEAAIPAGDEDPEEMEPEPLEACETPQAMPGVSVRPQDAFKVAGIPATVRNVTRGDSLLFVVTVAGREYAGETLADAVKIAEEGLPDCFDLAAWVEQSRPQEAAAGRYLSPEAQYKFHLAAWQAAGFPELESEQENPEQEQQAGLAVKPCQCCGGDRDSDTSDAMQPGDLLCASCDAEARDNPEQEQQAGETEAGAPVKLPLSDEVRLAGASRNGHSIPVYDDGGGTCYIHRDSMGISGIVRAQTWEDAYGICEDEFFPAATESEEEWIAEYGADFTEDACWQEAFGFRNNSRKEEDGSLSSIYAKDLNGDALDELTPALMAELEITLEIEPR